MKTYGEWQYSSTNLTSALGGGKWSASCPPPLYTGERAPPYPSWHHHHWQSSTFWATGLLRRYCQTCLFHRELAHSVFTSLDFATVIFLKGKVIYPCVQPPTMRTRSLYLCPPVIGWPSYTPRHWDLFSSPMIHRAIVKYSNLPLHRTPFMFYMNLLVPRAVLQYCFAVSRNVNPQRITVPRGLMLVKHCVSRSAIHMTLTYMPVWTEMYILVKEKCVRCHDELLQ
jgi:hypothetical protein